MVTASPGAQVPAAPPGSRGRSRWKPVADSLRGDHLDQRGCPLAGWMLGEQGPCLSVAVPWCHRGMWHMGAPWCGQRGVAFLHLKAASLSMSRNLNFSKLSLLPGGGHNLCILSLAAKLEQTLLGDYAGWGPPGLCFPHFLVTEPPHLLEQTRSRHISLDQAGLLGVS